jgi:predicted cupin superfamily sugar epimerase
MVTAKDIIHELGLKALPWEGGYFVETYRAKQEISRNNLGGSYSGPRTLATAIYYMLTSESFSAMHRLSGDEIFHFYLGDSVEMLQLRVNGGGERIVIGKDLLAGMRPQVLVPGGTWQGSRLIPGGQWALLGTTMAPGFDPADYTHGERSFLCGRYSEHRIMIEALTTG